MISAAFPYEKQGKQVLGRTMAYVEVGTGDPIVFVHGNPCSSYTWRNILPYVQGFGVPPWVEVMGYAVEGLAIAWSAFLIWRESKPASLSESVA